MFSDLKIVSFLTGENVLSVQDGYMCISDEGEMCGATCSAWTSPAFVYNLTLWTFATGENLVR